MKSISIIKKTVLYLITENNKGTFWGRIEGKGNFMPTGCGKSIKELINNIKDSIEDYKENEGKADKYWIKINIDRIDFVIQYDLTAFFEEFDVIKISNIAKAVGINESLMRQYASGNKYPSKEQTKKIEDTIHEYGKKLQKVSIYA